MEKIESPLTDRFAAIAAKKVQPAVAAVSSPSALGKRLMQKAGSFMLSSFTDEMLNMPWLKEAGPVGQAALTMARAGNISPALANLRKAGPVGHKAGLPVPTGLTFKPRVRPTSAGQVQGELGGAKSVLHPPTSNVVPIRPGAAPAAMPKAAHVETAFIRKVASLEIGRRVMQDPPEDPYAHIFTNKMASVSDPYLLSVAARYEGDTLRNYEALGGRYKTHGV